MMLRKDRPLQVTVKLPSINNPRPSSGNINTNVALTRPSSQPKSIANNLQKLLFDKLDDYDHVIRKQKREIKLQNKNMPRNQRKSQQKDSSFRDKQSSLIEQIKKKAHQALDEKASQSMKQIKVQQKQKDNTKLIQKQKKQQTFLTKPSEIEKQQEFQQNDNQQICPLTSEQISKLYNDYKSDDCYIKYTSNQQLKEMKDTVKKCDQDVDQLEKDLMSLISMVGYSTIEGLQDNQGIIQQQDQQQ